MNSTRTCSTNTGNGERDRPLKKARTAHGRWILSWNTLSNSLHWAVRKKKIKENPIAKRTRYYSPSGARHAKSVAPKSTDEFHEVGTLLFSDPRSESLGWQWCWEGMSGMRTEESIMLQFKPNSDTPGNVDGDHMWVRPSDKNDRGQPYLYLHDGLKAFLDAHARWHELRYPEEPMDVPRLLKAAGQPLGLWSLTTALDRLFENGRLQTDISWCSGILRVGQAFLGSFGQSDRR